VSGKHVFHAPDLSSAMYLNVLHCTLVYCSATTIRNLYGCETWSFKFREERRLRVFENRVLRTIFGPKKDEVIGSRENYVIRSLMLVVLTKYTIIRAIQWRRIRWTGHVTLMFDRRGAYGILVGNPG